MIRYSYTIIFADASSEDGTSIVKDNPSLPEVANEIYRAYSTLRADITPWALTTTIINSDLPDTIEIWAKGQLVATIIIR